MCHNTHIYTFLGDEDDIGNTSVEVHTFNEQVLTFTRMNGKYSTLMAFFFSII